MPAVIGRQRDAGGAGGYGVIGVLADDQGLALAIDFDGGAIVITGDQPRALGDGVADRVSLRRRIVDHQYCLAGKQADYADVGRLGAAVGDRQQRQTGEKAGRRCKDAHGVLSRSQPGVRRVAGWPSAGIGAEVSHRG